MRVLLDNNAWAWIADSGSSGDLVALEESLNLDLVTPPGILMEVLATPNVDVLQRLIATLCARPRTRLKTEVRLECDEVVDAVRAKRPSWLLRRPHLDRLRALEHFWSHRLWVEARNQPLAAQQRHHVALQLSDPSGQLVAGLLEDERAQRQAFLELGSRVANDVHGMINKTVQRSVFTDPQAVLGWEDDQSLPVWRVVSAAYWWRALVQWPVQAQRTGADATEWDWAGPFLNRSAMSSSRRSFNEMWYWELDDADVPRAWIRVNARSAQSAMKVTQGNPWDESLCVHLPDADVFVTADRRLAAVCEALRIAAPVPLAETHLLVSRERPVDQLADILGA